jgi:hypothetical protein
MMKMCKTSLDQCRHGKDFVDYAKSHGATEIRFGKGDHAIVKTDKGQVVVPVGHELGKGLRAKVVKTFILIGITACIWFFVILPLSRMI